MTLLETKMKNEYGSFEALKVDREVRASNSFKEDEIILIRRLWKLIMIYTRIMYILISQLDGSCEEETEKMKRT